jgi:hypothetical protein
MYTVLILYLVEINRIERRRVVGQVHQWTTSLAMFLQEIGQKPKCKKISQKPMLKNFVTIPLHQCSLHSLKLQGLCNKKVNVSVPCGIDMYVKTFD